MKNKITSIFKTCKRKIRMLGCRVADGMNKHARIAIFLIPVGALIIGVAIGVAVNAIISNKDPGEALRSAQYELRLAPDYFDAEENPVYTAEDGVIIIPAMDVDAESKSDSKRELDLFYSRSSSSDDTDAIWAEDKVVTYNSFTVQEKLKQADGSLGVLTIPTINLSANVYQAESEMESMTKGIAHFAYTSAWDGNVGLCSHNVNMDLSDGYFKNIHLLKKGDEIRFTTMLGERVYMVSTVKEIADTDWSGLGRTPDNRITMITCITGCPDKRLLVQAVENR